MTITEHPNALLIRQSWQAVSNSDVDTLKELWAEDIVWHVTTNNPFRGDHVGHDAVLDYLAQVGESGDSYHSTLESVMANEEYAVLVIHISTKRGEKVLDTGQLLFARFEGRRIQEVWTLPLDPVAAERFWAEG